MDLIKLVAMTRRAEGFSAAAGRKGSAPPPGGLQCIARVRRMVSVDQSTPSLDPKDVARAHRAVEPLHSHLYFAPEHDEYFAAVGLRPGRMAYFAGRAAPMGAVGAGS